MQETVGISGRIARAFLTSKLTPILVLASLLLGALAVAITSREEEPQIVVPMMDIFVAYPGATAHEVEERVTKPMERKLWEIDGVEYVYSITRPGMSMAIVRYRVGEDQEKSIVKLYNKLMANADIIPAGVMQPLVKPRSIDDVPTLAVTLWSERLSAYELRRVAVEAVEEVNSIDDVSETTIIGGERRQVRVVLDAARLRGSGLSALQVLGALRAANVLLPSGSVNENGRETLVETGSFLRSGDEVGGVVAGVFQGRPVYLRDVAKIEDGPAEPSSYVLMGLGPGAEGVAAGVNRSREYPAVTIAIAKKAGTNASTVAATALRRIEGLRGTVIPKDVELTVTRNYGETAQEKSDELLKHMLLATVSVIILVVFALGWREAVVVAVAVPVTLALTLLINYLYGYTLNRVTLFALIFSIGILVDDAIVVVENIHRHFKKKGGGSRSKLAAILAVDEVGNPTILATFTVIAALMPLAFVRGLMGPYMRPIPVGASAAMIFSLLVAFIVTPWLGYLLLRRVGEGQGHEEQQEKGMERWYGAVLRPLLQSRGKRLVALGGVVLLLGGAVALIPLKKVTVKMLPFDNKSELQVVIDMPEGTPLQQTARVGTEIGRYLATVPEVANWQLYAGAASPVQLQRPGPPLLPALRRRTRRTCRSTWSPRASARRRATRSPSASAPGVDAIGRRHGARVKIAEIPPGPPVLSTLVAEVYGPDPVRRREIARQIRGIFEGTDGVVDVDWFVEDDQEKVTFAVDRTKAALSGISAEQVSQSLAVALGGFSAGQVHLPREKEPVELLLRLPVAGRAGLESLAGVTVPSPAGVQVPLAELVRGAPRPRGEDDLPQEPAAGGLRRRRRRRQRREPGLRDSRDEGEDQGAQAPRGLRAAAVLRAAAGAHRPLRDEVGRRVADHLRGLPRHGPGLRGGARADLHPRGRLVPQLRGAAGDHGADPADARRHPARALGARGVLHGDLDDRLHRARRHRRAQLDPARGFRAVRGARDRRPGRVAGAGRRRALPPDRADGGGGGRGLAGDALRPDLPGPGDLDDVRRGRRDGADADRRAAALHGTGPPGGDAGARGWGGRRG